MSAPAIAHARGRRCAGARQHPRVDGQWANEGSCADPDVCKNGTLSAESCGFNDNGDQRLTCMEGQWVPIGRCNDPDDCKNGDVEKVQCHGRSGPFAHTTKLCDGGEWDRTGGCIANSISVSDFGVGCAVHNSGEVICWGKNNLGQLGVGHTQEEPFPLVVDVLETAVQVSTGKDFSCARTEEGEAYCWGSGRHGNLGNSSTNDAHIPVRVQGLSDVRRIAAGHAHACALLGDGTVSCWGNNHYGQLGTGATSDPISTPTPVRNLPIVEEIYVGHNTTCARTPAGEGPSTIYCWGDSSHYNAGMAPSNGLQVILRPAELTDFAFQQAAPRSLGFCGVSIDENNGTSVQHVQCIGDASPALGDGSGMIDRSVLNQVVGIEYTGSDVLRIESSGFNPANVCALIPTDNHLECWGNNKARSLGRNGVDTNRTALLATPSPLNRFVPYPELVTGILNFAVARYAICIINADANIECTGQFTSKDNGILGPLPPN